MSNEADARTVALLETLAEAKALIEELTRLGEELKVRQERLGELLAPSEAALKARTEYLDHVMREQLGRAEEHLTRVSNDVLTISRNLSEHVRTMPELMVEVDRHRARATTRRELWRTALVIAAAMVGGYLAGQIGACRPSWSAAPPPLEIIPSPAPTSPKGAPSPRPGRPRTPGPPAR